MNQSKVRYAPSEIDWLAAALNGQSAVSLHMEITSMTFQH